MQFDWSMNNSTFINNNYDTAKRARLEAGIFRPFNFFPATPTKSPVKLDRSKMEGGIRLKLTSKMSGDGLIPITDLCSNHSIVKNEPSEPVGTLLEKELESSSSCEKDVTIKTPHRTPVNSPIKHSMAPFSPSSYFINAPLSSSTPRHLRGSPRKRNAAEKENATPRLPTLAGGSLADRGLPKKDLNRAEKEIKVGILNLTPKRTVPFVPRTPTPFKRAIAALEKRHGTLNSTHDASLEDLSEVLSFFESPGKRSRANVSGSSSESQRPRKSARKQLHLDDDGYSSFSAQNIPIQISEMRLRASQPSSSLPHWKGAKSNLNKVSIKGFEREGDPLPPPLPVLSPHQLTTRCIQPPLANHPPNHESNSTPIPLQIHSVQIKTNSTKEEASSDDFFIQNREPSPQTWSTIATGSSTNQQNLTATAQAYLESLGGYT